MCRLLSERMSGLPYIFRLFSRNSALSDMYASPVVPGIMRLRFETDGIMGRGMRKAEAAVLAFCGGLVKKSPMTCAVHLGSF